MDPECTKNAWFEELCALSAIGECSAAEYAELEQHLGLCAKCRSAHTDFHRIACEELGLTAASRALEDMKGESDGLDGAALLSRIFEKAERARDFQPASSSSLLEMEEPARFRIFRDSLGWIGGVGTAYAVLGALILALTGLAAYRLEEHRLSPALAGLQHQVTDWQGQAAGTAAKERSVIQLLRQSEARRLQLEQSLAAQQNVYKALDLKRSQIQSQLATAQAQADEAGRDLVAERLSDGERAKSLADLESELAQARIRMAHQDAAVAELKSELKVGEQQQDNAATRSVQPSNTEASELFGARDLHIVDVYDVESSGKTRRTYGRVFYVENKLLVFYAFDLQDKPKNRVAAGFQAWGYSDKDMSRPQNLGLFYLDDPKMGRWTLKVHDPAILQRIDAVFVTLEPPRGSLYPRGRKLLYANLIGPANHP